MTKCVILDDDIANKLAVQLRYFQEICEDEQMSYSDIIDTLIDRSDELFKRDGRL